MNDIAEIAQVDFERAVQKMQSFGYAIVVFSPEELEGADPTRVEDLMIERGWEVVSSFTS
jgi:hypothetical protein